MNAHDFQFTLINGQKLTLSELAGKTVLASQHCVRNAVLRPSMQVCRPFGIGIASAGWW